MIDYIIMVLVFLYAWVASFVIHELMHIKSQGLRMSGIITVKATSLSAKSDSTPYQKWSWYSGGILSGLIHLILGGFLWYYGLWPFYVPFITVGVVNFIYGLYEGTSGPTGRYELYFITLSAMLAFWLIYFGVII